MSLMMSLRILSWNVRGANDPEGDDWRDIVCLQETKLKEMTGGVIKSLGWVDI